MEILKCKCGRDILLDNKDDLDLVSKLKIHCLQKAVHVITNPNGSMNLAHLFVEIPVGLLPDHKDLNSHNMQRSNIRPATNSQNGANQGIRKNNTMGFIGVNTYGTRDGLRYGWEIICNRKKYSRRGFLTMEDAAQARDKRAVQLFGEFATLNFPKQQNI